VAVVAEAKSDGRAAHRPAGKGGVSSDDDDCDGDADVVGDVDVDGHEQDKGDGVGEGDAKAGAEAGAKEGGTSPAGFRGRSAWGEKEGSDTADPGDKGSGGVRGRKKGHRRGGGRSGAAPGKRRGRNPGASDGEKGDGASSVGGFSDGYGTSGAGGAWGSDTETEGEGSDAVAR